MFKGLKILVVEYTRTLRIAAVFGLKERGAVVMETTDDEDAVELVHQHSFNLILTDIFMPEMN